MVMPTKACGVGSMSYGHCGSTNLGDVGDKPPSSLATLGACLELKEGGPLQKLLHLGPSLQDLKL